MRIIVTPGPDGLISRGFFVQGQEVPTEARIIDVESMELRPCERLYLLPDGTTELRYDYRGSGPWYDQQASTADRLNATVITEIGIVPPNMLDHPVSPGWQTMALEPRPETSAEKKAREKAEADAAAAKEAERRANRSLSRLQIRLAANQLGLRDTIENLVANPATPIEFRDYWNEATEYRRSHPIWPAALALIGKTTADLDALYDLGETL